MNIIKLPVKLEITHGTIEVTHRNEHWHPNVPSVSSAGAGTLSHAAATPGSL